MYREYFTFIRLVLQQILIPIILHLDHHFKISQKDIGLENFNFTQWLAPSRNWNQPKNDTFESFVNNIFLCHHFNLLI